MNGSAQALAELADAASEQEAFHAPKEWNPRLSETGFHTPSLDESEEPFPWAALPDKSDVRGRLSRHVRRSLDDFQLVKVLGKGCMGKVLLSREKSSSNLYAIKVISKRWVASHGPQEIEHTKAEQRILAELTRTRNPFLIRLHCSFQNHENLFLVLEYVGAGDLATQLAKWHRFCEARSRFYCAEMVEGIRELHRLNIIYRDLKPENVLLSPSGHIKLTDFGLSKQFRISHRMHPEDYYDPLTRPKTKTFCGTAEYLAPEVLMERPYGFEVDWWSLGTFLSEMLTGMVRSGHRKVFLIFTFVDTVLG
jgi:serine/threonine protein kinase